MWAQRGLGLRPKSHGGGIVKVRDGHDDGARGGDVGDGEE